MQLGGQPEAQGGLVWAPGFDWRRDRVPAEAVALVEAKQAAHYWRSMHARAKERWGQCGQRSGSWRRRGGRSRSWPGGWRELEQENAGLRQRQQELLKTPFGKRSEKRQGGSAGGPGQPGPGSAGTSQGPQRSRGGAAGSQRACAGRAGRPAGAGGVARAGGGPAPVSGLRAALPPQRRGGQRPDRDRGQGARAADPAATLPGRVRVRETAGASGAGSARAAGADAVPRLGLWPERVGGVPDAGGLAAAPGAGLRAGVGRVRGAPAGGDPAGGMCRIF